MTDASGAVVSRSRYDAFGNGVRNEGAIANKYLFAGEQFDSSLGDYYLRDRFYDAQTGRFSRMDIYEARLGDLKNLNKYVYAAGNPITNTDPSGLFIGEITVTEKIRADLEATYRLPAAVRLYQTTRSNMIAVAAALAGSFALAAATSMAMARNLNRQFGIPVVFWGNDVAETTDHQFRAVMGYGYTHGNESGTGFSLPISPALRRSRNEHDRAWLRGIPQGQNLNAALNDRDEFPYAKVIEGGETNYNAGRVSVHQLSLNTNRRQGRWLKTFWDRADVTQFEVNQSRSWFLNIPVPALGISFGLDRNAQIVNVYGPR
nr:RHS repeat-associated core domain-containing protein [Leptolyngbya sp. FACHB-161]